MNCAGDLSREEFAAQYLGQGYLRGDGPGVNNDPNIDLDIFTRRIVRSTRRDYQNFPTELDWEKRGKIVAFMFYFNRFLIPSSGFVTPVLNQITCNSCAAHASTSALETCLAIASSKERENPSILF